VRYITLQYFANIHPSPQFNEKIREFRDIYRSTRKAEVLNSLIMKITASENDTNDMLQTFR